MNKLLTRLMCGAVMITLAGCTVSTKDSISIGQPQRSASSSIENNTGNSGDKQEIPGSIAILPFSNTTEEKVAAPLLRQVINSQLAGRNFSLMHPAEVDKRLPSGPVDYTKMASYLGVEGVLVGEVVDFERFFAGIYSEIRLEVALSLYNTKGEVVWSGEHEVTQRAGGVSTTAWGLLLNAAIAAMNLDDENLLAAADELGRKVAFDFPQPSAYAGNAGPVIESVIHDQAGQWLRYSDVLEVGVKGEPGLQAFAELGNVARVQLKEVEPGVYITKIPVQPDWNQVRVPVTGILQGKDGNTSTMLSIAGLVNFDNTPPGAVKNLVGSQTETTLKLSWQAEDDAQTFTVFRMVDGEKSVVYSGPDSFANLAITTEAFSLNEYKVVAADRAGNSSDTKSITLTTYIKEVGQQTYLSGPLQGEYTGVMALTKTFSPYQVKGQVVFSQDSEIYVEPGVELQFDPQATITIRGEAYFWGLKQAIRIGPVADAERRAPYLILENNKATQISGVQMFNGGIGIAIKSGQPLLEAIEIIGSKFTAVMIEGEANVTLRHCLLDGSNTSGVVVSDFAKLKINDCTIRNNFPFHIQNASSYEIDATGNAWDPKATTSNLLGKIRTE
ncbi:right-handed parallel beta-helix repeat-containing protein [Aestuariibacter sp. GS-14]|uniref:right-handed parallel beta-helix repeat-containing protein n=1 Tax=Alteromonadaceae TaxID=72275 RepID=UPI00112A0733|nr:right-handed parallel beta-helix repeat-containing protein [Aestuariibacter sp. GS-14]TPV58298.1 right-handed parallel beta-helix repeat-containing protein [Aestuariibacter sp. GS-14]